MKITRRQLKRIIRESLLQERSPTSGSPYAGEDMFADDYNPDAAPGAKETAASWAVDRYFDTDASVYADAIPHLPIPGDLSSGGECVSDDHPAVDDFVRGLEVSDIKVDLITGSDEWNWLFTLMPRTNAEKYLGKPIGMFSHDDVEAAGGLSVLRSLAHQVRNKHPNIQFGYVVIESSTQIPFAPDWSTPDGLPSTYIFWAAFVDDHHADKMNSFHDLKSIDDAMAKSIGWPLYSPC